MAKGTYERTPLVQARFQLTITERRIETLKRQIDKSEAEKRELEAQIAELTK